MALAEAVLVLLAEEPLTGYDLAKRFDTSIGFFWRADHQQIYRVLHRLRDDGLVTDELVVQDARPNKRVYSINEAGRQRLWDWSQESTRPPSIKDDLMVRLYALDLVSVVSLIDQIRQRQAGHRQRLALYERIELHQVPAAPTSPGPLGRYLGLQLVIRYESSWIEWCDDALARLEGLPGVGGTAEPG